MADPKGKENQEMVEAIVKEIQAHQKRLSHF
jgi:hypothetical protein